MTTCPPLSAIAFAASVAWSSTVNADALVIILDISGSTPATQPNFLRAALPILTDHIATLPVPSRLKVFTVGDDKAPPMNLELWVQRGQSASGDTAKALAERVPAELVSYLLKLGTNRKQLQGESSLSAAFLDASKWCQVGKPCSIIYFTDGMEYQPGEIEWPRDMTKPLPAITDLDLRGANVYMYGVGQGVATKARISAEAHWQAWLKAHKAGAIDLRRL